MRVHPDRRYRLHQHDSSIHISICARQRSLAEQRWRRVKLLEIATDRALSQSVVPSSSSSRQLTERVLGANPASCATAWNGHVLVGSCSAFSARRSERAADSGWVAFTEQFHEPRAASGCAKSFGGILACSETATGLVLDAQRRFPVTNRAAGGITRERLTTVAGKHFVEDARPPHPWNMDRHGQCC